MYVILDEYHHNYIIIVNEYSYNVWEVMEGLGVEGLFPFRSNRRLSFNLEWQLNNNNLTIDGKEIGAGNFGTVFKARYNFLPCIVKVLHPNFQSVGLKEAVYRESSLISSLRHPNIVQFIDVQDYIPPSPAPGSQPLVSLIMELMEENLTTFLSRYRRSDEVPLHRIIDICHEIALALHYLHTRGIMYGILSSNNVLFLNGRTKISDIGVSKIQGVQVGESSVYAAPEARINRPSLQSDVFSFGILLIQMITLKYPEPRFILTHDHSSGSLTMATELNRRKTDIARMPKRHKLRSLVLLCIADLEKSRPTTAELCNDFEDMKRKKSYRESLLIHIADSDSETSSSNEESSTESDTESSD